MSRARGLQNVSSFRRKLRNMQKVLEDSAIPPAIRESAQDIRDEAVRRVPIDEGTLANSIELKTSADGLTAVIGPAAKSAAIQRAASGSAFANRSTSKPLGALSKKKLFQFFKGYWLEFGTKGHTVKVKSKKTLADGGGGFYGKEVSIPAMSPRPFMGPAFDATKNANIAKVRAAVNSVLKRAGSL